MKFVYREADLRKTIFEQVFPDAPEEITKFGLEHIALGQIIKIDGENTLKGCVIEADENGLLVVLMHHFKVDKAIGYQYFKFANIQGIKVKEGMLFYKLTFQFFDGKNYVIRVQKRNTKHLPNQHENIKIIVDKLHDQNLRDMDNEILKKSKKEKRILSFFYVTTLIIFLGFALNFGFKYIKDSFLLFLIIIIGTGILHFVVFMFAVLYLTNRKERPFTKEFNAVMNTYRETDDAYQLLENLSNLKNQPKTQEASNAFNLSMSTALFRTNQLDEAFDYLNAIDTKDENLLKAVEQQRAVFEGKEVQDPID